MLNNLFLGCLGLYCRWNIYQGNYGRSFDDLTPEQAVEVKKNLDENRQKMKDNGGFFISLWTLRHK